MPATADAPAPAAPSVTPGPTAIPQQSGEIHVVAPTVPKLTTDPEPGSAKAGIFGKLREKAGVKPAEAKPAEKKPAAKIEKPAEKKVEAKPGEKPVAKPGEKPAEAEPQKTVEGEPQDGVEPKPGEAAPKAGDKKVNPWKMVDDYKKQVATLTKERDDARALLTNESDRGQLTTRAESAEKRNKELEDYLRYVDYSKTSEFKTQYVEPYNKAWASAMGELKELTVQYGEGQTRAFTADDMLQIVQMPITQARKVAEDNFGSFANDIMQHRKVIRDLFEKRETALKEARENGAETLKKAQEAHQAKLDGATKLNGEMWAKENEAALADATYGVLFKPREGDENWNKRLAKGFELVDQAFAVNLKDPNLSPEERLKAIRRHAAVRNRAASWGAIRGELEVSRARVAELEKELAEYKASEPGAVGDKKVAEGQPPTNAKASITDALRKLAK